jgi:hypothetical protein
VGAFYVLFSIFFLEKFNLIPIFSYWSSFIASFTNDEFQNTRTLCELDNSQKKEIVTNLSAVKLLRFRMFF